jgi:hypothetical protein
MLLFVSEYIAHTTLLREQTDECRVLTTPLFLISQLVLPAYEATTRWTLRADLAVIEPQFSRKTNCRNCAVWTGRAVLSRPILYLSSG